MSHKKFTLLRKINPVCNKQTKKCRIFGAYYTNLVIPILCIFVNVTADLKQLDKYC